MGAPATVFEVCDPSGPLPNASDFGTSSPRIHVQAGDQQQNRQRHATV